ncbi:hypothetical protein HGRIS_010468 [Hohenbuehelia grisea]|uniref:CxC2-like cysteine cluster KDZ transposase-associated domain-containing protein n=1 Tax=Hohenbuehelia grisea TaxID=104357 RepID=A0ABR3IZ68_9AGAR
MGRNKSKPKHIAGGLYTHAVAALFTSSASVKTRSGRMHQVKERLARTPTPPPTHSQLRQLDDKMLGISTHDSSHDLTQPSGLDSVSGIVVEPRKKYLNSQAPLLTWIAYRDLYLEACMRLEGRGLQASDSATCAGCTDGLPTFRCRSCLSPRMLCQACMLSRHADQPLHCIEGWSDSLGFFQRVYLRDLGLRIQVGHPDGSMCALPKQAHKDFLVIDSSGHHPISLDFCGCNSTPHFEQLLSLSWWPATPLEPQTCFTFALLRLYHVVNLQGNTSATDFYRALEQLTDGRALDAPVDRLQSFMVAIREWRHIKMAKRAGRAYDPDGINGTIPGGFAIPCRACPRPNVNLPENWELAPANQTWLYRLIVAQDANFRLKNRLRSSDKRDPSLNPGFAYFVADDVYLAHLSKYITQEEISHCVGFAAIWLANKKARKGLRTTGVGSVSCARHEMFLPRGTGNLQAGERYCNMDYLFSSAVSKSGCKAILSTYDIGCQWGKKFLARQQDMPIDLRLPSDTKLTAKVPKFHLAAHITACQAPYSLNFTPGAARTDGKGVERNWSWLNRAAPSTSQMGPGARHDMLDDFCGFSNFRKTQQLGQTLLCRMVLAIPQAITHREAYLDFSASIRRKHEDQLLSWESMVLAWERDQANPCPYDMVANKVSLAELHQQLAEAEHHAVEAGLPSTSIGPSDFIMLGLAIEDTQYSLCVEAKKRELTPTQATSLQKRRTAVLKKTQQYKKLQPKFMPGISDISSRLPPATGDIRLTKNIPIHLPSSLPADVRESACIPELPALEEKFSNAHAHEALEDLRRQLRIRTLAYHHKGKTAHTQGSYTRARTLQNQVEEKICLAALLNLRGTGEWEKELKPLLAADIRAVNERELNETEHRQWEDALRLVSEEVPSDAAPTTQAPLLEVGEGHRLLSWIWINAAFGDAALEASGELHKSVRVEWVKGRAWACRWLEEVELLEEEMRRSLASTEWLAEWWEAQVCRRSLVEGPLLDGLRAYAHEQAYSERRLAASWADRWASVRARAATVRSSTSPALPSITVTVDLHDEGTVPRKRKMTTTTSIQVILPTLLATMAPLAFQ